MYIIIILFLLFFVTVFSNVVNDLIVDYFVYKNTPSVIGFSCNEIEDDLLLIKKFNKNAISATFKKLDHNISLHQFGYTNYNKLGILLDIRCYDLYNIVALLSEAGNYRMYNDLHCWLIIVSDITNSLNILNDKAFGYSTDFVIAVSLLSTSIETYELYDVYNLWKDRGTLLNVSFIGRWKRQERINIDIQKTRFARRSNLQSIVVKASFYDTIYKPQDMTFEEYFQDYSSRARDGLSKFGFIIISHLSDLFNFKLQCIIVPIWKTGDPVGPTIRSIYKSETDITGSPAILNLKRMNMARFTYQSWPFRTCFIFRSPQRKKIQIKEIIGPLDNNVWYLTVVVLTLSVCILAFVFRYEKKERIFRRYSDSLLITFGAISLQGADIKMSLTSTRIVYFFITMFGFLLYNYYSAIIVTIRLNEPIFKYNDSLAQLSKTDLKFFSEFMVYFSFFINRQDWETKTFARTWKNIPESERWMDPEQAILLVQKGGYAYHTHPDVAYPFINRYYNNREICELTEVHLQPLSYSNFGLSLNSTIIEMIRIGLTKISEVGLRKRQEIRWKSMKPVCHQDILSASSLNIYEFAPHLLILMIGMVVAIILFILELPKNRHRIIEM